MDQKIFAITCPMMWKKFKVLKFEQVMSGRKLGGKKYPPKTGIQKIAGVVQDVGTKF